MRGGAGVLVVTVALVGLVGVATASGAPIVSAGLDQDVVLGDTVYLDGGGTHVPEGELDQLEWSIETPDGRTMTPNCVDCEQTSFRPNATGQYNVTLTAWSESGIERADTLYVTVGAVSTGNNDPVFQESSTEVGGGGSGGDGGCFIAHEGNDGDAMSDRVCNSVGDVVDTELSDSGDYIESYTVENGELVDDYTGAGYAGGGKWEVPADPLHYESDDIWAEHQEKRESSGSFTGGSDSGRSNIGSINDHPQSTDSGESFCTRCL